ncbi:MAG: HK97-gp10 family putative phage morphogenesis protein [Bacillota bacterium]
MGIEMKINSKVNEVMKKIDSEQKKRAKKAGLEAESDVKEKLTGDRSGRTYKIPGTNKTYTASSPGEPPAQRTGETRGSISHEVRKEKGGYGAYTGSPLERAPMLEFGTKNMEPRPFLKPTLKKNERKYIDIMSGRWF